jgi:hypothetical protein
MTKYVIARNAGDRPTLQHAVTSYRSRVTLCGWDISMWTRSFSETPMTIMLCKRCKRIESKETNNNIVAFSRRMA